ncbi:acyl-CoA dehydrogenase family protein [Xylophilus sp.]|uniref:acyl-CoA dehydrogenase family protein n=1 Tax=Xylophilus sp. TaxID=2653893 RepID=UPI0013BC1A39|nr:acyl-CoA dehydrogenase family protein [Xylophilus sp.]KAF1046769.1 MAG: Dibenzothiophene desulfurization enzyme C [Xylophilus sp.]
MTAALPTASAAAAFARPAVREDFGPHADAVARVAAELAATAAERDRAGGTALAQRQLLRASGLLTLAVPRAFGGPEAPWPLILHIVRRFAAADSSLAHLFGFQHLQVAGVILFGSPAQQQRYLREGTVEQGWFWGNAVNGRDPRLQATRTEAGWQLDGVKSFCSGAADSDVLSVSVSTGDAPTDRIFAIVPTHREGVAVNDDWDNLGQRQTDSGTVRFDRVQVAADEVLRPPGVASSPRATLRNLIGQLVLTEIYLGNAQGALDEALAWLATEARAWPGAGVERPQDDPLLLLRAGELWLQLRAAVASADLALADFQAAWNAGLALTWEQRGELAIAIAAARVQAARTALHVTAQIFELTGARSTARRHGFDRYWRNVRVHTLHDPVDYRAKGIGRWLATGQAPEPYGYG